jgi:hypothetical protein
MKEHQQAKECLECLKHLEEWLPDAMDLATV